MKRFFDSALISAGLAVFSMFFGAGNLMFPIKVGLTAGSLYGWAIAGFCMTGVLLPFMGLVAIVFFEGDYRAFFYRLGKIPGFLLIFLCINIIGPCIAMPRIVTLSHTMIQPFIPAIPLYLFAIIFLGLTYWGTYKESRIIDFLGTVISPLLLISLIIIIVKGILQGIPPLPSEQSIPSIFLKNVLFGSQTLDLLGGIFFSAAIMNLLRKMFSHTKEYNPHFLARFTFKAGLIGVSLLTIIYVGLAYIAAYCGTNLVYTNAGDLFSSLSFAIMGERGAAIIALAVLMACYSTIIALATIYAEFLQKYMLGNLVSYQTALLMTLLATGAFSLVGLDAILTISITIINIVYPSLIVLTSLNGAYKLWGIKTVKAPVFITLLLSIVAWYMNIL